MTATANNEVSTTKRQQKQQQQKHRVQQPPRTPQEFAFAHRTLRKLVQDSEFFPECAQRDDWFKFRPHQHFNNKHERMSNALLNNHNHHHDDDDNGESSSTDESSDNNSRQTPLFIDYCNRSLESLAGSASYNSSNNSLNNNHRCYNGGSVGGSVGRSNGSLTTNNNISLLPSPISPRDVVDAITSATTTATAKSYQLPFQVVEKEIKGTTTKTATATYYNNTTLARRPSFPPRLIDETGGGTRRIRSCHDEQEQLVTIMSNLSTNANATQSIQQSSQTNQQQNQQQTKQQRTKQQQQQQQQKKQKKKKKKKKKHSVYSINENELEFGKILGNGGFGQVRLAKIRSVGCNVGATAKTTTAAAACSEASTAATAATNATAASTPATPASDNATDATTIKATTDSNIGNNNKKKSRYYAMKYLSPTKLSPSSSTTTNNNNSNSEKQTQQKQSQQATYSKFERAIADLAIEARFLSLLSHTNIINLYYVSEGSLEELFNCDDGSGKVGGGGGGGEGERRKRRSGGSGRVGSSSVGSLDPPGSIGSNSGGGVGVTSRRRRRKVGVVVGSNNNHKSSRRGGAGNVVKRKNNIYHPRRQHGYFLLLDPLCETLHQRIQSVYVPEVIDTPLRIYNTTTAATNNNFDLSTTYMTSLSEFNNSNNNNTNTNKKYISNESQARIQLSHRLSSLKSIASALQYLHEDCNIVYRDIKPGNIGFYRRYDNCGCCQCGHGGAHSNFDEEEDVGGGGGSRSDNTSNSTSQHCTCNYTDIPKLFDFGLAKELKSKYRKCHPNHNNDIDPPTYKLTSASGSRRYMSPEVALREPYNHKADVYSFGVVLYQIAALVVPFDGLEIQSHERDVMRGGIRPDLSIPTRDSSVRRTRDFRKHYAKERDRERKNLLLSKRAKCVWPEGLGALIGECWDGDMRKRPEMREVVDRLDACIQELQTGQI